MGNGWEVALEVGLLLPGPKSVREKETWTPADPLPALACSASQETGSTTARAEKRPGEGDLDAGGLPQWHIRLMTNRQTIPWQTIPLANYIPCSAPSNAALHPMLHCIHCYTASNATLHPMAHRIQWHTPTRATDPRAPIEDLPL